MLVHTAEDLSNQTSNLSCLQVMMLKPGKWGKKSKICSVGDHFSFRP